ncbi:MAG: 2-succinyl-5-enolpyruvyl-6-hydroxy-3-cyclohexene-1-carboxylic-acid synthase [Ulvibacter sp.]|nr:2-succinyl-5-enolpyruvyl-6-hydroxy-3-cyclohexene-1-carboxylic-acid synthase [Ulvibacter sp.]
MQFSSKILSQTITKLCLDNGIDHIVISPGSRNAALTIGFTGTTSFTNFSIVDERCAAFFALGLAQQLQRPVALVCTSGSALLNYYPAIAEAYYSDIPLVVLSADRPAHLLEIGDGQTIKQENVFANHILYSGACTEGEEFQKYNEDQIHTALSIAISQSGPVHLNLPFSEPLYDIVTTPSVFPENHPTVVTKHTDNQELISEIASHWNSSSKKMILTGVLPPNSLEANIISQLAEDSSVVVLTETTSNVHHPNFFPAIDQLIAPLEISDFRALQPEVLITFGGMVVSKKIKKFLREYPPKVHYHIDAKKAFDTYFCLTKHVRCSPNHFFKEFLSLTQKTISTYQQDWLRVKNQRLQKHELYLKEIPFSDFLVFSQLFKALPNNIQLQLSNSSTIRYGQLFEMNPSHAIFCNRGTSGIDGSTSTAIGAAHVCKTPTVFITGDLSFFYDSNALWNQYITSNFKIIIINNSGGGIFRILPDAKQVPSFDTFFETKHQLTASQLSDMHGFDYQSANDMSSLKAQLAVFFENSNSPKVLEIFTPSHINDSVLLSYFDYIK